LEKRDTETTPTSEPPDLAADIQHVSTTTTTAISVLTNTATPAIYETTTTPATDLNSAITKIEQQADEEPEARRVEEDKGVEKDPSENRTAKDV
jgi:hypothetical protein